MQELLNKFRDKKVDFAAHTNTEDGGAVFLSLLGALFTLQETAAHCITFVTRGSYPCCQMAGNLAFPLLLVGGLFLLSRRSGGGPGMGGGPGGNPMQFGKSKAKFQMEPNTGITFDDVAGVDEAKQDFMEVSLLSMR